MYMLLLLLTLGQHVESTAATQAWRNLPAAKKVVVLQEDVGPGSHLLSATPHRTIADKTQPCPLFHTLSISLSLKMDLPHFVPFLFVDEFNQALAEVIKVKDLDVQNFDGPLDFRVHTIPFLQRIVQVLLGVLDATLQL